MKFIQNNNLEDLIYTYKNLNFMFTEGTKKEIKEIVDSFVNCDLGSLSNQELLACCQNLHNYVSKVLNISSTKLNYAGFPIFNSYMESFVNDDNDVYMNLFDNFRSVKTQGFLYSFKTENLALCYIFCVIHETCHIAQYYDLGQLIQNKKTSGEYALTNLVELLNPIFGVKEKYSNNLCEIQANIFALNFLKKLVSNNILENNEANQQFINQLTVHLFKNISPEIWKEKAEQLKNLAVQLQNLNSKYSLSVLEILNNKINATKILAKTKKDLTAIKNNQKNQNFNL